MSQITGDAIQPIQIVVKEDKIILRQADGSIYTFDRFGQFLGKSPYAALNEIQVSQDWIISFDAAQNRLNFLHLSLDQQAFIALPTLSTPTLNARKSGSLIFLKTENQIWIYRYLGE